MWGLHLKNPGELELKEFPVESPLKENEVRIKLIYGGICGSDIGVYKGKIGHAKYPVRPGHELVGRVIEVGEKVDLKTGTKVVVTPNTFCGECENCQRGYRNICSFKESLGVNVDGIFSEEISISSKYVLPIPEELQDEKAVLIEPFAVITHAFEKAFITKGTTVGVIGCGTEGMLSIALANFLGAKVTAIDIYQSKLEKVKAAFGVHTVLAHEVKDEKFDVVIEAAGVKQAVEQAVRVVKQGGSVILIGLTPEATLPIVQIVRNEITIHGSIIYNFPEDFSKCVDYLLNDDFDVKPIISNIFPLKEFKKAYIYAISGQCGKILLDFKGGHI
ncbi:alcohol dehydrogenase GroES-like protein [Mycobacteroides abscessus subsp. abscessus]|nr:alcohol dehydrogenase GroES-like protein [Mycobacteroides abscessus subsp. abscessus]